MHVCLKYRDCKQCRFGLELQQYSAQVHQLKFVSLNLRIPQFNLLEEEILVQLVRRTCMQKEHFHIYLQQCFGHRAPASMQTSGILTSNP